MAEISSSDFGRVIHQWEIPETAQYRRGRLWYAVAIIILLSLVAYALFTANFLFALMVMLFAAIIFMGHTRAPLMLNVAITEQGVAINNRLYRYPDLKSFWIIDEPPAVKNLYLEFQSRVRPPLSFHLDIQDCAQIRQTLAQFLAEDGEKREESLTDVLSRLLKL